MNTKVFISGLSLSVAIFLTACGGGGSSTATSKNTGYFVDSPVAGVEYETSTNIKGITGPNGEFHFEHGDKVTFHLGKLNIGTVTVDDAQTVDGKVVVAPKDLYPNNHEAEIKTAQFLMSLDSDHNPENGITISENTRVAFDKDINTNISIAQDFKNDSVKNLPDSIKNYVDKNYDNKLDIAEEEAQKHLNQTKEKIEKGEIPGLNKKVAVK